MKKQRKETTRFLAVIGGAAGALGILFPTALIGVCANPMMICQMIMLPTLVAAGTLAMVTSAISFMTAREPQIPISGVAA